jgi:hypothetical protein
MEKSLLEQHSSSILVSAVNCHFINPPNSCILHLVDGTWGYYKTIHSLKFTAGTPTILAVILCFSTESHQINAEILSQIRKQLLYSISNWYFTYHPTIWRHIIWVTTNEVK